MANLWGLILYVWIILAIWQIVIGAFWLRKTNEQLTDGGWAYGRLTGWLLVSLLVWFGGHFKLPINTIWGVRIATGIITSIGGWQLITHRMEIRKILWEKKWFILVEELLFTAGLVWLIWVRAHNPDILDLEKFMDAGFIQSYLRSPTLPIEDMWLAGEKINYYTFGHFMGAIITQVWGVDMVYSYNLLLGLIMGLTLSLTFSVIINLVDLGRVPPSGARPKSIIGGLVGAILVGFGGNTHTIWSLLRNQTWNGYWYADATRFIYNTIHEFPAYSFVVSDLHGHVWDLPIVLMFLGCLVMWIRSSAPGVSACLGILLGVMAMTNTWDTLVYGMLVGIVGVMIIFNSGSDPSRQNGMRLRHKGLLLGSHPELSAVLSSWGVMVVAMVIVALPWKLNFESIDQGVRLVTMRTPLWQLGVLWGGHLIITAMAVIINAKSKSKNLLILAMAIGAIILLIIPELVYVKDIYPNHPRANTMFKLTYQAFILMSILGGWVIGKIGFKEESLPTTKMKGILLKSFLGGIVVVVTGSLMTFPYFPYRDYYGGLKMLKGLDGLNFMARDNLADYQAIGWIKQNVKGRPVILEAVGESYTQHGRFSVFTGLPTVLGWRVHEWLWRGGFEIPGKRTEEVKTMYEKPTSEEAKALWNRYQVKYVIIGNLERTAYKVDEKGFKKIGKIVFDFEETEIIQVH